MRKRGEIGKVKEEGKRSGGKKEELERPMRIWMETEEWRNSKEDGHRK